MTSFEADLRREEVAQTTEPARLYRVDLHERPDGFIGKRCPASRSGIMPAWEIFPTREQAIRWAVRDAGEVGK